ncbi:MAG: hypothetical protein NC318_10640, partial [Blautia sp.]|nr:hypothetical protein [Blautia sp.]
LSVCLSVCLSIIGHPAIPCQPPSAKISLFIVVGLKGKTRFLAGTSIFWQERQLNLGLHNIIMSIEKDKKIFYDKNRNICRHFASIINEIPFTKE